MVPQGEVEAIWNETCSGLPAPKHIARIFHYDQEILRLRYTSDTSYAELYVLKHTSIATHSTIMLMNRLIRGYLDIDKYNQLCPPEEILDMYSARIHRNKTKCIFSTLSNVMFINSMGQHQNRRKINSSPVPTDSWFILPSVFVATQLLLPLQYDKTKIPTNGVI